MTQKVTQKQYQEVMGTNPSAFGGTNVANAPPTELASLPEGTETSDFPVDSVSWNDAAEFCAKRSQQEKLKPLYFRAGETITPLDGTGCRLPTEAEWEFACGSGTTTRFWIGDKDEDLVRAGWFGPNSGRRTHEVGELTPNPFGLDDMHGNVWEWVQDWWEPGDYDQFAETPATAPSGASASAVSQRVIRGGRWHDGSAYCRASDRYATHPANRHHGSGFRRSLLSVFPRVSRP